MSKPLMGALLKSCSLGMFGVEIAIHSNCDITGDFKYPGDCTRSSSRCCDRDIDGILTRSIGAVYGFVFDGNTVSFFELVT